MESWIDKIAIGMFDTSDPGPRVEGPALSKVRKKLQMKNTTLQFASMDVIRRTFPGHPLFAKPGEEGYNPLTEARMKAIGVRQAPPGHEAIRLIKRARAEKVVSPHGTVVAKGPGIPGGAEERPDVVRPYQRIRTEISREARERKKDEVSRKPTYNEPTHLVGGEPVPGEELPARKVGDRGGLYTSWKSSEVGGPEKIIHHPLHEEKFPIPTSPLEREKLRRDVSIHGREWRDPIPWHKAEVEHLGKENLIRDLLIKVKRKRGGKTIEEMAHVPGAPKQVLPKEGERGDVETRKNMQAVRDWWAGEAHKYRRNIPVEYRRKVHPIQLYKAHREIERQTDEIAADHLKQAESISNQAKGWAAEISQRNAEGRNTRDWVQTSLSKIFSHEHGGMSEGLPKGKAAAKLTPAERLKGAGLKGDELRHVAGWMGVTQKRAKELHDTFLHHSMMGSTEAGRDIIRTTVRPKVFETIPLHPPKPQRSVLATSMKLGLRKLRRMGIGGKIGIGAGAAGAVGAAGYGAYRALRKKPEEHKFDAPGEVSALGKVASKLRGWSQLYPNVTREAVTGAALTGGISAADAAVSAINPDPGRTRAQSAWAGAKRGALYGGVLAGAEPLVRRPLMKRLLGDPNLMHSKLREIRLKANNDEEDTTKRDIAIGAIEAGTAFPLTERAVRWLHPGAGPGRAITAGAVGGLATGTIGYGLNRFVRAFKQKQRAKRTAQQNPQLASKLKEIHFNAPNITYDSEGSNTPYMPGKRRITVAQDRYKKLIRQKEIGRKEGNLTKSAVAGAALGALLRGKIGAGIGAGTGLATSAALTLRNRRTRDPFGEESIGAKRVERLPWQVGGAAAAGLLGHKLLRQLTDRTKLILFQDTDAGGYPTLHGLITSQPSRWLRAPITTAESAYKWHGRAQRLRRDIAAPKTKAGMVIDERGRTRTPEWKKDWAKRALGTGLAVGGLLLAGKGVSKLKKAAAIGVEGRNVGAHITPFERLAANVVGKPSNAMAYIKSKIPKFTMPGAGHIRSIAENLHRSWNEALSGASKHIEKVTGAITGGKVVEGGGGIKRVEVKSPLAEQQAKEKDLAEAAKHRKMAEQAAGRAERRATKPPGEKMISDIIKGQSKEAEQREKDIKNLRSELRLLQFQYADYPVQVKPHFRRARGEQKKPTLQQIHQRHAVREGLLLGGGALATIGGVRWGLTTAEKRRKAEEAVMKSIKDIVAHRPPAGGLHALSATLDHLIEFGIFSPGTAKKIFAGLAEGAEKAPLIRPKGLLGSSAYLPKTLSPQEAVAAADQMSGIWKGGKGIQPHSVVVPRQRGLSPDELAAQKLNLGPDVYNRMAKLKDPVAVAAHEYGHAYDPDVATRQAAQIEKGGRLAELLSKQHLEPKPMGYYKPLEGEDLRKAGELGHQIAAGSMQHEVIANQRVMGQVQQHGTPEEVEAWRRTANQQMKVGYRSPMFKQGLGMNLASTGGTPLPGQWMQKARQTYQQMPYITKAATSLASRWGSISLRTVNGLLNGLIEFKRKVVWEDNPLYPTDTHSTVQEVPIRHIISHQETVQKHIVNRYKKKSGRTLPILHKKGGKYYVEDGNHRIVSKIEKGEKTVRARVLEPED